MTYEFVASMTPLIPMMVIPLLILLWLVKRRMDNKVLEDKLQEIQRQRQDQEFQREYTKAITAEKREMVKFIKQLQDQA